MASEHAWSAAPSHCWHHEVMGGGGRAEHISVLATLHSGNDCRGGRTPTGVSVEERTDSQVSFGRGNQALQWRDSLRTTCTGWVRSQL